MKMYRNYDGNRSTFGDTSVRATRHRQPDNLSVFAAERTADGALTVMVIAKVPVGRDAGDDQPRQLRARTARRRCGS